MKSLFHVTLLLIVVSTAGARLYGVQLSIHNGSFDLVEINEEAQNTTFILSITKKADPLTYEPVAVSDSAAGLLHVAIPMNYIFSIDPKAKRIVKKALAKREVFDTLFVDPARSLIGGSWTSNPQQAQIPYFESLPLGGGNATSCGFSPGQSYGQGTYDPKRGHYYFVQLTQAIIVIDAVTCMTVKKIPLHLNSNNFQLFFDVVKDRLVFFGNPSLFTSSMYYFATVGNNGQMVQYATTTFTNNYYTAIKIGYDTTHNKAFVRYLQQEPGPIVRYDLSTGVAEWTSYMLPLLSTVAAL